MRIKLFLVSGVVFGLCMGTLVKAGGPWDWRIVGGQDADDMAFPYQIALKTNSNSFFCGGFIYSKRTVITAAHCIRDRPPENYTVLAGTNTLDSGGVILQPNRQMIHPEYDSDSNKNDIALVFLDRDIVFDKAIQPIALEEKEIGPEVKVVLSGWGRLSAGGPIPNNLQYINLLTLDNTECQLRVGLLGRIHDSIICARTKRGEGACNGDSGGPLAHDGKAVGVVNWGLPCARGLPDMYARISSFVPWIQENAEN